MSKEAKGFNEMSKDFAYYTAQQKFSTNFIIVPSFVWILNILFYVINKYVDLKVYGYFLSTRQNGNGLGVSGLELHFMPCACKYTDSTSEIKTFILT